MSGLAASAVLTIGLTAWLARWESRIPAQSSENLPVFPDMTGSLVFVPDVVEGAARQAVEKAAMPMVPAAWTDLDVAELFADMPELSGFDDYVSGVVLRADGSPASGALVYVAGNSRHADSEGEFRLGLYELRDEDCKVWAFERGSLPARAPLARRQLSYRRTPRSPVVLKLGGPALSIRGRVVDEQHRPLAGWMIAMNDPWVISSDGPPWTCAESFMGLQPLRSRISDADGRFEIKGLMDREYDFSLYERTTLRCEKTARFPAGEREIEIVVPSDTRVETVRGTLVALDGTRIESAEVALSLLVFDMRNGAELLQQPAVRTDAEGAFVLHWVPQNDAEIRVRGDMLVERPFEVSQLKLDEPIRLSIARLSTVRITGLPKDGNARRLFGLTSWGVSWNVSWRADGYMHTAESFDFTNSELPDLIFDERVELLRLFRYPERDVEERAVKLKAGTVTILKW